MDKCFKKFLSFIIPLIFIFCFITCHDKTGENLLKPFSNIFVSVDTIRLETNKDCIIPLYNIFKNWNKKWYVCSLAQIFLFDKNGKYIKKFGRKGEGPGEFTSINEIIKTKNGNILIFDPFMDRITVVDSELNYIKTINGIIGTYETFFAIGDKYCFYNRNLFENNNTVFIYDSSFKLIKSIVPFPYNSVVQVYWGGSRNMVFANDLNKLIVTHLFDPVIKIVDLNNWDNITQIPLNFPYWTTIKETEIRKVFPHISTPPHNLYKFLKDKTVLWQMYYLKNGLLLIKYRKKKEKIQFFQIFDLKRQKSLVITSLPEDNLWITSAKGFNADFIRTFYEADSIINPYIIKFKINLAQNHE